MNSVAVAAEAALDMNTLACLQEAICYINRIGTAYDGVAYNASATAVLNPYLTTYLPQQFDSMAKVAAASGLTSQQLGG
jgi:hypothetical protein